MSHRSDGDSMAVRLVCSFDNERRIAKVRLLWGNENSRESCIGCKVTWYTSIHLFSCGIILSTGR